MTIDIKTTMFNGWQINSPFREMSSNLLPKAELHNSKMREYSQVEMTTESQVHTTMLVITATSGIALRWR